jgi:hypothetical protein
MAELRNDRGALRCALTLAGRAAPPGAGGGTGGAPLELLATAAVEYLDGRDAEWWPLVRLPPLRLAAAQIEELLAAAAALLRGEGDGFAWRAGEEAPLALQLGAAPGGAIVEVGLDLSGFLAEAAGAGGTPGGELALFRFRAAQADLVRFSDALAAELGAIRGS